MHVPGRKPIYGSANVRSTGKERKRAGAVFAALCVIRGTALYEPAQPYN